MDVRDMEIVLVSSGHTALDHRVFDKEAVSLAKHYPRVRVVAAHPMDEMRYNVVITAVPRPKNRLERFLAMPVRCLLAARGSGKRLLILHDAELLVWAPVVRLLTGWRVVYDVHEDFAQLMLRRRWVPSFVRRLVSAGISFVEKTCARGCDGIIGVTDVLAEYFHHPRRVALYNLPSREFSEQARQQARPIAKREYDMVHVGTLSEERLEFLCAVLANVLGRQPQMRALIIGAKPAQQQRLASQFTEAQVTVLGAVGYHRIAGFLGNSRIGLDVHPVLYPHLRCAIPVKVFEYMAAGCNVVTSFLPELHKVLGDEGAAHVTTLYTASAVQYAEEILRLLLDTELLEHHGRALQRLVDEQWNWEHEAEKLTQFIEAIAQGKESEVGEQVFDH